MKKYTRVYVGRGAQTAHLLREDASPNSSDPAICGRSPSAILGAWGWFGTGSQNEEEVARDLRLCMHCDRVFRKIKNAEWKARQGNDPVQ